IQFAGSVNFDTQIGNLNQGYMGENNKQFSLNDSYLTITGRATPWANAFMEISFNNIQNTALISSGLWDFNSNTPTQTFPGVYSSSYSLNKLDLQQGYITFGNPALFPIFLKIGKQFQDYGNYTLHPITRSLTQVMTETLQTSVEISFISPWNTTGFHGSFFTFENEISNVDLDQIKTTPIQTAGNHGKTNFGGQLGISRFNSKFGVDLGVGYIYDLMGVTDIAYANSFLKNINYNTVTPGSEINTNQSYYIKSINGLTTYAMVNSGPFSLNIHYATALQSFDFHDINKSLNQSNVDYYKGAKPWAFDIQAAYGFNYLNKNQNLYVGYQQSGNAVALFIPQNRWLAGYGVAILDNASIGLEYTNDQAYGSTYGGNNKNSSKFAIRANTIFG
ncbi:LbtU family siderophore porin, partial [Gammaproteobacteria bacterium]|nr:LbtU family siderophore porin [Gammaproteobacteria bacterium]